MNHSTTYSFETRLTMPITEARQLVLNALKAESFGLISEIDISAKLQEKLGVSHEPHIILGACNPTLAHEAMLDNPDVALALPCNVVLREIDKTTIVSALLPSVALQPFTGIHVQKSSCTAEESLQRVFNSLSSTV